MLQFLQNPEIILYSRIKKKLILTHIVVNNRTSNHIHTQHFDYTTRPNFTANGFQLKFNDVSNFKNHKFNNTAKHVHNSS